jgi:hypothetical protein
MDIGTGTLLGGVHTPANCAEELLFLSSSFENYDK